jgi:hypothetical protein
VSATLQRLDRAWRSWLNWTVFGVGAALIVVGSFGHLPVIVWAGYTLWLADLVVNVGYGVALLRLLSKQREARRRARFNAKETT